MNEVLKGKTSYARVRNEYHVTQRQVARAIGISHKTYQNYEYGTNQPSTAVVIRLADYYGCTTDHVLGRDFPTEDATPTGTTPAGTGAAATTAPEPAYPSSVPATTEDQAEATEAAKATEAALLEDLQTTFQQIPPHDQQTLIAIAHVFTHHTQ